jgi:hypothetical protein
MRDVFGNVIQPGDVCALSARIGKHDTCIKIFFVTSVHEDEQGHFLRGYDGAGRLTQVQKASNVAVVTRSVSGEHPRLKHILERLTSEELDQFHQRKAE